MSALPWITLLRGSVSGAKLLQGNTVEVDQMSVVSLVRAPTNTVDVDQMSVVSLVRAPTNTVDVDQLSVVVLLRDP